MEEYKSNSHKYRDSLTNDSSQNKEKKIEKVVEGPVKVKKKSEAKKIRDIFISDDISSVKSFVLMDVLVPSIKKAISDIVTNGIEMILYGETNRNRNRTNGSGVSYRNYYDSRRDDRPIYERDVRSRYDYNDIILNTRGEAEYVLNQMDEILETYKIVSVADLYDLVGITSNYTDNKYGWINLRNADVIRVRDGYLLKLPKALPINN